MDVLFKFLAIVFFFFSTNGHPKLLPAGKNQPNIIFFFVDDMGWQDTSVPFWKEKTRLNSIFRTPNMERLAQQGMKFTQAYATPVCSPSRVSLMTGMNAARHRVTNWTLYKDKMQPMEMNHPELNFPFWNVNGLSINKSDTHAVYATPLPEILKKNGYRTIHIGKAHFGAIGTVGESPLNLGFEVNIGGHAAGAPESYYGKENFGNIPSKANSPWPVPGLSKYHASDINLTEALTLEAIDQLNLAVEKRKPFFLYLSHYAVHTPIMADHRFYQTYLQLGLDSTEAKYASMVESMDKSLGDLMDFLEKKNISKNTIILFMSDNGGLSAVARGGSRHMHNQPLKSGKGSIYEGGIREPMLVKWPGVTTPNSVNENYMIIEDLYPTFLEMANIKEYKSVQKIDGVSLLSTLTNPKKLEQDRSLFWHYPNSWGPTGPGIAAFSAIRKGDWKLIYYHADEKYELFNIGQDIGETNNLILEEPEIKSKLAYELGQYLISVDAQMPFHKSTGLQTKFPGT